MEFDESVIEFAKFTSFLKPLWSIIVLAKILFYHVFAIVNNCAQQACLFFIAFVISRAFQFTLDNRQIGCKSSESSNFPIRDLKRNLVMASRGLFLLRVVGNSWNALLARWLVHGFVGYLFTVQPAFSLISALHTERNKNNKYITQKLTEKSRWRFSWKRKPVLILDFWYCKTGWMNRNKFHATVISCYYWFLFNDFLRGGL